MKLLLTCLLAALFAASCTGQTDRPNVLFIVVDDLNDWVGCLNGHPQTQTPNIDTLADHGVLFTNAHCQAPICAPSRISFMTGRFPASTGCYLIKPNNFRLASALKNTTTMPMAFANAGYKTMGAGKLFHNASFSDLFDTYGPRGNFGPFPNKRLNVSEDQGGPDHAHWDWGVYPLDGQQMSDEQIADYAINQLTIPHKKPFFLAAGFLRPHVPMYAPPKWFDQLPLEQNILLPPVLENDTNDIPVYGQRLTAGFPAPRHGYIEKSGQWHKAVKAYLASIAYVDNQIGRVLKALENSEHASNTLIVLFSDHGFALGEKRRWAKRALWERETRVPLIIAGPGVLKGVSTHQPVGLIDLYPTLNAWCKLNTQDLLEGISLTSLLTDPDATLPRKAITTTLHTGNHALRSDRYRFIQYADGTAELYDHSIDANEWHNLINDPSHQKIVNHFKALLPKINTPAHRVPTGLGCRIEDRVFFNVRQ